MSFSTQQSKQHVTPFGLCLHDFTVSPCPFHINCLNGCSDYLRRKGDEQERARLLDLRERTLLANIAARKAALTEKKPLAASWIQHNENLLAGIDQALKVDADEQVPNDSFVAPFENKQSLFKPVKGE